MNNEGETYLCSWRKDGKRHIIIASEKGWEASGASFEDAEAELMALIESKTADLRPNFEYVPERPKTVIQARYEGCGIVAVSGGNDPEELDGNPEELFSGGICPVCKMSVGARTSVPLKIAGRLPANTDGAFVRIRIGGPFVSFSIEIFSVEFLDALTTGEKSRFKWLPVEVANKPKRSFFEPVSVPFTDKVMPKGLFPERNRLQPDGIFCQKCGRKELRGIPQGGGGIYTFVSEDSFAGVKPSCFHVGQLAALEFCMLKARWAEMVKGKKLRRLVSRQVGMVRSAEINRAPKLEELS